MSNLERSLQEIGMLERAQFLAAQMWLSLQDWLINIVEQPVPQVSHPVEGHAADVSFIRDRMQNINFHELNAVICTTDRETLGQEFTTEEAWDIWHCCD